jgi:hypothetical protein
MRNGQCRLHGGLSPGPKTGRRDWADPAVLRRPGSTPALRAVAPAAATIALDKPRMPDDCTQETPMDMLVVGIFKAKPHGSYVRREGRDRVGQHSRRA